MGNKSSQPSQPWGNEPRRHLPRRGVTPLLDASWYHLEYAPPLGPLELIESEAIDRSGTANGKLSLRQAWEIAMAWREPLLNKVFLETECHSPKCSIIETIAWVRFAVDLDDHATISVARAAAETWVKLASCPGYGGDENPVFWKCVFSEHWGGCARLISRTVDDSVEFFTQADDAFPRFMLDGDTFMKNDDSVPGVILFCGDQREGMARDVQAKLDRLLIRLQSFVAQDRMDLLVSVCLGRIDSDFVNTLRKLLPKIGGALSAGGPGSFTLNPSTCRFRVVQLNFDRGFKLRSDSDIDGLCDLMEVSSVKIGHLSTYSPNSTVTSSSATAKMISYVFGIQGNSPKARTRSISLPTRKKQAFVSALPFATTVHSIDYRVNDDHDLAWLAYALFHPETPSSSWRSLTLTFSTLSKRSADILAAMSRGNNLDALLNDKSSNRTGYYSGRLTSDALVKTKPSDSADTLVEACNVHTRIDMCGAHSTRESLVRPKLVAVIVPAYGLGWVRSQDLVEVECRPPSTSSIIAFSLVLRQYTVEAPQFLLACASYIGSRLCYLDIAEFLRIEGPALLREVLMQCPSLETLVAHHAGELWADSVNAGDHSLPRLSELELHVEGKMVRFEAPSLQHLQSTLSHLTALRVRGDISDQFPQSGAAIVAVLTNGINLRYFHWKNTGHPTWRFREQPRTYAKMSSWSSQLLNYLPWEDDSHLFVYDQSRGRRFAAFLSVNDIENRGLSSDERTGTLITVLARLDRDVLRHIFQFVPIRMKRSITVDPKFEPQRPLHPCRLPI